MVLVLVAAVPSFVLAQFLMNRWLQNFVSHTNLNGYMFVAVLSVTVVITVLSTVYFALKTATSNPAKNLKYE